MTYDKVEKAMERKNPELYAAYKKYKGKRIHVLQTIALDLWINKTPDDEDTEIIREALNPRCK